MKFGRRWRWVWAVAVLLVGALGLLSLSRLGPMGEYARGLPGGYSLVAADSTVAIWTPEQFYWHESNCFQGIAVAAVIEEAAIIDSFVVGRVAQSSGTDMDNFQAPGYFVIDTKAGIVRKGLSRTELETALAEVGIANIPDLRDPRSLGTRERR